MFFASVLEGRTQHLVPSSVVLQLIELCLWMGFRSFSGESPNVAHSSIEGNFMLTPSVLSLTLWNLVSLGGSACSEIKTDFGVRLEFASEFLHLSSL